MMIDSKYEHLHRATEAALMQPRFEKEISHVQGKPVAFEEFWVTRVFPRKDASFAIQYSGVLKEADSQSPKRLLLCGSLLGPSVSRPDYVLKRKGRSFFLEDLRLAVPIFPFDPAMPRLRELYGLDKISLMLGRFADSMRLDPRTIDVTDCEVLGYRLERRCVLRYTLSRCEGPGDQPDEYRVVAKIMRPGRSTGSLQALTRLAGNGFLVGAEDEITVPQLYCSDDAMGTIFMENAPGTTLHLLLGKPIFVTACGQAGRLLRKLHAVDVAGLRCYTAKDEMESFGNRFRTVIRLYPQMTDSYEQVLQQLNRQRTDIEGGYVPVCAHRDFHDKQILYTAGRTTLLDSDNLAQADPALDFGNFLAHLVLRRMQHPECAGYIGKGMRTFASAYGPADSDFRRRAGWWMSASLVRLAALYSLRPRWRSLSSKLLEEAGRCLDPIEFTYGGTNAIDTN